MWAHRRRACTHCNTADDEETLQMALTHAAANGAPRRTWASHTIPSASTCCKNNMRNGALNAYVVSIACVIPLWRTSSPPPPRAAANYLVHDRHYNRRGAVEQAHANRFRERHKRAARVRRMVTAVLVRHARRNNYHDLGHLTAHRARLARLTVKGGQARDKVE